MNNTMTIQELINELSKRENKSELVYIWVGTDLMNSSEGERYPIDSVDLSLDKHIDINLGSW